jgi:PIN domain nuclease of toxin-antitoxin system
VIVLDTHVLLWLALEPERLSATAAKTIESESDRAIATISVQEIAYLVVRGRVDLYRPVRTWFGDAFNAFGVRALPAATSTAIRAGSIDPVEFHGDPFDRLIYATAAEHDAQLVTADERLRRLDPERVVW